MIKVAVPEYSITTADGRFRKLQPSNSAPNLKPAANAKGALKSQIVNLVKHSVKERTGPSFEDRLEHAVAMKSSEMRHAEKKQWRAIRECKEKGEDRAMKESPFANISKPPSAMMRHQQQQLLAQRKQQMGVQVKEYMHQRRAMMEKIRNREPLFRLSEVKEANDLLQQKAAKRRQEMKDEEKKRWEMLEEINKSVLTRPLLMDQ
jgi:hypothetical protein